MLETILDYFDPFHERKERSLKSVSPPDRKKAPDRGSYIDCRTENLFFSHDGYIV